MIFDLILFPLFLCTLYVLACGVLFAGRALKLTSAEPFPPYYMLVIGLLSVATLSLLVNFFSGVDSPVTYAILLLCCVAGSVHALKIRFSGCLAIAVLGVVFAPFTTTIPPGADTGLYHLPHQLWIRSEAIVFGLAHMHSRFGFSSLFEYLAAPLWVGEDLTFLTYAMASFPVILVLYVYDCLRSGNPNRFLIGCMMALSLLIYSDFLYYDFTSTDIPTAIIFAIAFLQGLTIILEKEPPSARQLGMFFLSASLCFMFKASGLILALWVLYVVAVKKISLRALLRPAALPAVLLLVWLVHGVILTGCILFPLPQTCIDVPWAAEKLAAANNKAITAWARQPGTGLASLESWAWFGKWWWPNYKGFVRILLKNIAFLSAIYLVFFKSAKTARSPHMLAGFAFIALCLAVWFLRMPTVRFGFGFFIAFPIITILALWGARTPRQLIDRPALSNILLGLLIGKLAFWDHPIDFSHVMDFQTMRAPVAQTEPKEGFGVRPLGNDGYCWLAEHCSLEYTPPSQTFHGYRFFIPQP